ncbi:hypothetical protein ACFJGW_14430 [Burkholderiaceae bacterium UC74_6]
MRKPASSDNALSFRAGAGALGLFAGIAIGLLLAWLSYAALASAPSFPVLLLGGAVAGLVTGLVLPSETLLLVEAVAHFFVGLLATSANVDIDDEIMEAPFERPRYLRFAAIFGAALAISICILSRLN